MGFTSQGSRAQESVPQGFTPPSTNIAEYLLVAPHELPSLPGELRIPALAVHRAHVYCFFDVRPVPQAGPGWEFNGKTLASDLPNPNEIWFVRAPLGAAELQWTLPEPLAGGPRFRADACTYSDSQHLTVAYAVSGVDASLKQVDGGCSGGARGIASGVGYLDSSFAGPRLEPWIAWGEHVESLAHRRVDELYNLTGADALFATSGSTVAHPEQPHTVLVPYVVRTGDEMGVRVAHFRVGELVQLSEPIVAASSSHSRVALDETSLSLVNGKILANSRVQGFAGKGSGLRYLSWSVDGVHFSPAQPWPLPDPGCNGKQLGEYFVHPHSLAAREDGAIVNLAGEVSSRFSEASFGYSDAVVLPDERVLVVFERDCALYYSVLDSLV